MDSNAEQIRIAKIDAARSYLNDVVKIHNRAEQAQTEYRLAVEHAGGLSGIDYTRDRVATSVSPDAIPSAIIKYDDMLDTATQLTAIAREAVDTALSLVGMLAFEEASVLRMKYILGLTVKEISTGLYMSDRTVARRLNDGLANLYELGIPAEYRINRERAA